MLSELFRFYFALILAFFIPGYTLLKFLTAKSRFSLSNLEKISLSFLLGLVSIDFLALSLDYLHIPLKLSSLLPAILFFSLFFFLLSLKNDKRNNAGHSPKNILVGKQVSLFLLLLFFSIFLRGIYIADGIIPKTTDLGHHIYWAKTISLTGKLPVYEAKFIIGEHIPFAIVNILSGLPYVSAFPVTLLLLFNVFTLLGFFIFLFYLAENILPFLNKFSNNFFQSISAGTIALWGLFVVGVLYPITAPQAKFVSGGVIGNVIGNLLIIFSFYSFWQIFYRKSVGFVFIFLMTLTTLAYTHHLSTLVFGISFLAIFFFFAFLTLSFLRFNIKTFFHSVQTYGKLFLSWKVILFIIFLMLFIWQVQHLSYLNKEAVSTAIGTPEKATRIGISLPGIINRLGAWRVFFAGIFFVIFLFPFSNFLRKKIRFSDNFSSKKHLHQTVLLALTVSFIFAWTIIIFLLSHKPALFKIDIPSGRIITYLTYPVALSAGFGVALFFFAIRRTLPRNLTLFLFLYFLFIGILSGFVQEIHENLRSKKEKPSQVMETYVAAKYLAEHTSTDEMVLKDHKYLPGDTWIKLFFMRGFKYPLSRTYDHRYEDKYNPHETCTRDMIAIPDSKVGQDCLTKTNVHYIFLRKGYDDKIFLLSPNWTEIYTSAHVRIFKKK